MTDATTHFITCGGLIPAAYLDSIRELDARQAGTEPKLFAIPGRPPPSRAALFGWLGAEFWTTDRCLGRAAQDEPPWVRVLDVAR